MSRELEKGHIMNIKNHPHYTENDYRYLKAKGWTNKQILARWNEERAQGKSPVTWGSKEAKAKLADILN